MHTMYISVHYKPDDLPICFGRVQIYSTRLKQLDRLNVSYATGKSNVVPSKVFHESKLGIAYLT
jgi:hypothetical protein